MNLHHGLALIALATSILAVDGTAMGQTFSFGAIAGVPLTNDFFPVESDLLYTGEVKRSFNIRSLAGVMAETQFTKGLSIELDGIYRRLFFKDGPEVVVTWFRRWRNTGLPTGGRDYSSKQDRRFAGAAT
jgi:hypothetical protein